MREAEAPQLPPAMISSGGADSSINVSPITAFQMHSTDYNLGDDEKQEQEVNIPQENTKQNPQNPSFHGLKYVLKHYKWWLQMAIYTIFVLAGQTVGTLLGRLYFTNGGNSNWMATLVQCVGFPVLIPFLFARKPKHPNETSSKNPQTLILSSVYIILGIFLAADCMLYSIGTKYLPVTTYTLICASQLAFNALFSYFLNRQKITPYILNSLVLLTISSTLLVFQNDSDEGSTETNKRKYVLGFVCTLAASAGYALMLSITQLVFQRIIRRETIRTLMDMVMYQNVVASFIILIGLFASGEWKDLSGEMRKFKPGKVAYVMNLVGTAVSWQAFSVGCIGLIFKVSSLFSNVISIVGLPLAPFFALIFLHEKMTGLKGISMVLAIWGFVSYMYQHYLDDLKTKAAERKHSGDHALSVSGNEDLSRQCNMSRLNVRASSSVVS